MKFFLDTANLDEIKAGAALGIVEGSLPPQPGPKEGQGFQEPACLEICEIIPRSRFRRVVSVTCDEMLKEARTLSKLAKNIIVKLPIIPEGVKALKILHRRGHQD